MKDQFRFSQGELSGALADRGVMLALIVLNGIAVAPKKIPT
jgi:hypothetical protein